MIREAFRRWLPTEAQLRDQRGLRWLGPLLARPWLWHLSRRRVAAGAAIGVFFGFLIPVLQIAFAAGVAVLLRANLPVAAAATLVSNPVTYAPIFVLAYRTGAAVLGDDPDPAREAALSGAMPTEGGWGERVLDVGKPLFAGLALFAAVGAAIVWVAVNAVWIFAVRLKRRRRRRAIAQPAP